MRMASIIALYVTTTADILVNLLHPVYLQHTSEKTINSPFLQRLHSPLHSSIMSIVDIFQIKIAKACIVRFDVR